MSKKRYNLVTFGCQMNEHDSETIEGILQSLGYEPVEAPEKADLILYNTCCVRENPERKVYGRVGVLKALKEKKPGLIIGICGCMVQQKSELENIMTQLPHVDLIFGTHNIHRLPELLDKIGQTGERVVEVWDEEGDIVEGLPVRRQGNLKAWVTVMYGCTNFCSYCIVPFTRGKERSRRPEDILAEVEELAASGFKEVTLLGQNVNSYGKDLRDGISFAKLLLRLDRVRGLERIRFTTSHPKDMTDELIRAIRDGEKICEHIHLPLQAGSDRILNRMNRCYDREHYLRLVDRIRAEIPDVALTTDLIAGFPGETDDDFRDTLGMMERVRFDAAFTFIYSPRTGTAAASMPDQVPEEVKKARVHEMIEVQNRISLEKNRELLGKNVEVLVEGISKTDPDNVSGRTRTNKIVAFPGTEALIGRTVAVEITEAHTWSLKGMMVD